LIQRFLFGIDHEKMESVVTDEVGSQMSAAPPGLDAAHDGWFHFDRPDEVRNGLYSCSFHRKPFDRDVLGLTSDRKITVSQRFTGRSAAAALSTQRESRHHASQPKLGQTPFWTMRLGAGVAR
jgi:hypothetical protein